MTRVAVMFNPQTAPYVGYYLKPLETAASKIDVKTFEAPVRSDPDIEAVQDLDVIQAAVLSP